MRPWWRAARRFSRRSLDFARRRSRKSFGHCFLFLMSGIGASVMLGGSEFRGPGVDEGGMGEYGPFLGPDSASIEERVERFIAGPSFPPSGKMRRGGQSGADFRNGLLHGFRPSFRPLRRVSRKRPFFGAVSAARSAFLQ